MRQTRLSSCAKMLNRGVAVGVLAFASFQAQAQQAAGDAANGPAAPEEIVVTGSRITRSGFTAPTPVTVVGQEQLEQRAITNVGEALNDLPSFRPLVTPATQQAVGGNIGARVLDLRGLGATRTLVLLDGKRFVPSTTQGTIDVNLIPSAIIGRTEVVTGGASAAYGSDAVAGVVNFIIDKKFDGLKASTQYGISQRGDAADFNASVAYGTGFAEDRGHFIAAFEYDKAKGMGDCYARSWCPREQLVGNSPAGYDGLPASIRTGPDAPGNLNQDGLINTTSGPLRGITFNPDGTTRNYQYGHIFGTNLSPLFTLGGEGTYENGYLQGILLIPPVKRFTAFAHADYQFSDALKANIDLSYGRVQGTVIGSEARTSNAVITRDNAFLPQQVADIMDANGISSFTLGRVFGDLGGSVNHSDNKTYRAVVSFEGDISDKWSWDAYYQYGRNKFEQVYTGNVVMSRLNNALDAVMTPGGPACRINTDAITSNDDPACAALNPFGRGNISDAARAYVAPSGYQTADTTEHVVAGNLHGELFDLPGGPLAIATGVEYRSDKITGDADALSAANAFWSFNGKAINGKIDVTEGYIEANAPLVKDLPFAHSLELNGAVRRTHYKRTSPGIDSTTTNVTTWKGGIVYEPIEQIRLRATRSRDIRAPNLTELFGPVTAGRTTIVDPENAGSQIQVNSLTGANPLLKPEKADTWTAGVVFSPTWEFARSLRISVDYYEIKIDGAIATLGAQTIVQRCSEGATEFCPLVTRDPAGTLVQVQDVLQNVNRQVNRGIDIEASYSTSIGSLGALNFRLLATRYLELSTRDTVSVTDRAGQTGYRPGTTTGVPDWILDGNVTWNIDNVTVGAHGRYIPKGVFDVLMVGPEDSGYDPSLPNSVSSNRVNGRFYLDLNANVRVGEHFEFFGAINNVFDKDPPLAASAQGGTNQVYFDPIGRYFKIGARIRM
ncbi:MAG TPA: TonB-dependent receptor [Sphingomonadaceae bacterium]|nr:TonB-dependent receptor [Sphingomonadaceae bacterium]